jgi:LacI family transcriptional regulator
MQGFSDAIAAAGLEPPAVQEAAFDERGGSDAMARILGRRPRPTAVFVSNINQAVGAFAAARGLGIGVPADVSVVGYDEDPLADYMDAPLTTIRMPLWELGATAVTALIGQLRGEPAQDVVVDTPPQLVLRASTAPPA